MKDIRKEQYPKLIFGSLILIKRLLCVSREIADQVESPFFKHCKSMLIELCDKTFLSSLYSLSYTTLDLNNSTHKKKSG